MGIESEKKCASREWVAWFVVAAFYFYQCIVRAAPGVMEDELTSEFAVSTAVFGAAVGALYYVYSPMQLFVGVLFNRFGGKKVLVPAVACVAIGCLLSSIPSESIVYFAIGRGLTGLGASFAFVGTLHVATMYFDIEKLSILSGLTLTIGLIGTIVGQAPVSALVSSIGWRATFLWMAGIGIVILSLLFICLPKDSAAETNGEIGGNNCLSMKEVLKGLVRVFRNKKTWIVGIIGTGTYAPVVVFGELWGIPYLKSALGVDEVKAAYVASMMLLGWMVGGPLTGWIAGKFKCRAELLTYGGMLSAILFLVILLSGIKSPSFVGFLLFLIGVLSSPQSLCFVVALEVNEKSASGSAMAVTNMIIMILSGMLQPIVGLLIGGKPEGGSMEVIPYDVFRNALLVMPLFVFVSALLSFFFFRKEMSARARM